MYFNFSFNFIFFYIFVFITLFFNISKAELKKYPLIEIDEEILLNELKKTNQSNYSLELESNEANFFYSQYLHYSVKKEFDPMLYTQFSYSENRQLSLISQQPIFSPERYALLGVKQRTSFGLKWDFYTSNLQQDADGRGISSNFKNATTHLFGINLEWDLWQDFLGHQSSAILDQSKLELKESELEKTIADKRFNIEMRKIYWNLVANNQSINLTKQILKISEQQWQESKRRKKISLAQNDEVARYEAHYEGKKATLALRLYQKEKLIQTLKSQISSFAEKFIELKPVDLAQNQKLVIDCIKTISQQENVPFENTDIDEQIKILSDIQLAQEKRIAKLSDIDIKLFTNFRTTGISSEEVAANTNNYRGSNSGAWNDLNQNDRWAQEIGVKVIIPLGKNTAKLEENQRLFQNKSKEVEKRRLAEDLRLKHQQFATVIILLEQGVAAQTAQTDRLKFVISSMQKKYEQARISLTDLLANQENHFNAELQAIDSRLEVLNYLLDYLKLFPRTKCAFNKF